MRPRRRRPALWILLAMCAAGPVLEAQQRDTPAATTARSAAPHTGSVSGVVTISATSDEPVRRAVVSLISVDGGDGSSTVTDDAGRFVIQGVADGRYSLVAEKPAYLTTQYGAKRPGRAGVPIVIAKGQPVDELRIALPKGAVIAGRLSQPNGAPIRNGQVFAIPIAQIGSGGRYDTRARQFYSDDQGAYRIYGLPPGDYVVGAMPAVLGLGDVERRTTAQYEEAVRRVTRGAGRPGETAAAEGSRAGRIARMGYAPTYHPGTPVAADAARIQVKTGEVRDGVDIPIAMFAMTDITGTVIGVDGLPTQAAQLSVTAAGPPLPQFAAAPLRLTPPDAQGRFTISNVAPGVYTLMARGGGVTVDARGVTIRSAEQTDWAMTRVQVTGHDVEGVMLSLQPGLTFSGRVDAPGAPAPGVSGTRVALVAPGSDPSAARLATVDERGAFTVTGLHPDTYELIVTLPSALSAQWAVRSVMSEGIDVRDRPLTLEGGSLRDVAVTLTQQRSEVAGTLATATGTPTSDYFIVVFPESRALWHRDSPRVRVVRPGANGTFSVRDLPAGTYRIAALTDVEADEWRQASFLESVIDASVAIVVRDGATTRQDLRIQ